MVAFDPIALGRAMNARRESARGDNLEEGTAAGLHMIRLFHLSTGCDACSRRHAPSGGDLDREQGPAVSGLHDTMDSTTS